MKVDGLPPKKCQKAKGHRRSCESYSKAPHLSIATAPLVEPFHFLQEMAPPSEFSIAKVNPPGFRFPPPPSNPSALQSRLQRLTTLAAGPTKRKKKKPTTKKSARRLYTLPFSCICSGPTAVAGNEDIQPRFANKC